MRVFEILPDGFFSVLTGKNRDTYVDLILVIREEYKRSLHMERSSILALIANLLSDLSDLPDLVDDDVYDDLSKPARQDALTRSSRLNAYPLEAMAEENVSEAGNQGRNTLSGMAHLILRRLISTGWLEQEQKSGSFEFLITIPHYSIGMMDLLFEISQEDTRAYKSYAFAAYSALRGLFIDDDEDYWYTALVNARDSSRQLVDALKMLLNNIRRYHRKLGDFGTANMVLKDHFDEYQQLVNERIFHPLVTRDAVQRFQQPILQMTANILSDERKFNAICKQGIKEARFVTDEEASESIRSLLYEIQEIFENVSSLMNDIQMKNNAYTKASVDKLIYLLYQDHTKKQQIAHILMRYSSLTKAQKESLTDAPSLTEVKYFDEQSLYTRGKQRIRSPEAPLKLQEAVKSDTDLNKFLTEYQSKFSYVKSADYVRHMFGERDLIYSSDFPMNSNDDFIYLLMSVIYGSENRSFYRIEFLSELEEYGSYQYPRIRYSRKRRQNERDLG